MSNIEVNEFIAILHNDGYAYAEISEKVFDKFGEQISPDALRKRVHRMRERGNLDFITRGDEPDILTQLDAEIGLFKTGVIDIETTGLWADFGYILVAIIKDIDTNEYEILRLDECKSYKDRESVEMWRRIDKEICQQIRDVYEKYDIIVHFNGRSFDIKFINTRLLKNGLQLLPDMKQLDIYQIARHRLRLRSRKLDALKEFLEVDMEGRGHRWEYWQMAANGVKEGFDYVVEHCMRDVDRLCQIARKMKPFINYIKK